MLSYIYYFLGYEEDEIKPDEKVVRIRDELLKQVRQSKLKLNPVIEWGEACQIKPVKYRLKKKDDIKEEKEIEDKLIKDINDDIERERIEKLHILNYGVVASNSFLTNHGEIDF